MFVKVWSVTSDAFILELLSKAIKGIKLSAKCLSTGDFELISSNRLFAAFFPTSSAFMFFPFCCLRDNPNDSSNGKLLFDDMFLDNWYSSRD